MAELDIDGAEIDRTIEMWRPQAEVMARKSSSPDTVALFLKAKGIPHQEACGAAIVMWETVHQKKRRGELPHQIIGWGFILMGAGVMSYMMVRYQAFTIFSFAPVVMGCWILWRKSER